MKKAPYVAAVLLLGLASTAFAITSTGQEAVFDQGAVEGQKNANIVLGHQNPVMGVGGDVIASATVIPGVPYSDGGNTCTFIDDYDEVCPYTGSTSPDVVYSYTPAADEVVSISLCNSSYDTKVYVYLNAYTPGNPYACNDDACSGPNYPWPYLSLIDCLPLTAGNTYYIVVDGYGGDCGDYILDLTLCEPCVITCPPGATLEGEPVCADDYNDLYNGGCNSVPPVFTDLHCNGGGETVCGEAGTFIAFGLNYRDTDWYRLCLSAPTLLDACVESDFVAQLAIIQPGPNGCADFTIVCGSIFSAGNCDIACCQVMLGAGEYWIFVATADFVGIPCGSPYLLTVTGCEGCPGVATENASWGQVKELFR